VISTIKMPLMFIEAELETLVSNVYIKKFYELNNSKNSKSQFVTLKGVDHSNLIFETNSLNKITSEIITFYNSSIT
jgi:hypothetical protein